MKLAGTSSLFLPSSDDVIVTSSSPQTYSFAIQPWRRQTPTCSTHSVRLRLKLQRLRSVYLQQVTSWRTGEIAGAYFCCLPSSSSSSSRSSSLEGGAQCVHALACIRDARIALLPTNAPDSAVRIQQVSGWLNTPTRIRTWKRLELHVCSSVTCYHGSPADDQNSRNSSSRLLVTATRETRQRPSACRLTMSMQRLPRCFYIVCFMLTLQQSKTKLLPDNLAFKAVSRFWCLAG